MFVRKSFVQVARVCQKSTFASVSHSTLRVSSFVSLKQNIPRRNFSDVPQDEKSFEEKTGNDDLILKLQNEVKDLKDQLVRSLADQQNTRRIAKNDVDNAKQYANSSFAKSLLDVADDLERALESVPKELLQSTENSENEKLLKTLKTLYEGIEMTEKQLHKVFANHKITKFGSVGDKFDPSLHNALFQMKSNDLTDNSLGQVLKKGYKLHERVIREAHVGTVNNN